MNIWQTFIKYYENKNFFFFYFSEIRNKNDYPGNEPCFLRRLNNNGAPSFARRNGKLFLSFLNKSNLYSSFSLKTFLEFLL